MEGLKELIIKWDGEIDRNRRIVNDPLMWTKENRLKAAHETIVLCAIVGDLKKLESKLYK
jgi:hypothetical protein